MKYLSGRHKTNESGELNMQATEPIILAGPCAVEDAAMFEETVQFLVSKHIYLIRAGIFKPRTNKHSFQGLGTEGLRILSNLKRKFPVSFISEILDIKDFENMAEVVDIFQIGSRNMSNYALLKELGKSKIPVLLKRGMCATIYEFACAAGYLTEYGNKNIILCERGIRSFDTATRNILDLSCVPLIKKMTELPVIVDLSHSLGRKDIAPAMGKAALACGADGIMIEVHPTPATALCDAKQQMNFSEFDQFLNILTRGEL